MAARVSSNGLSCPLMCWREQEKVMASKMKKRIVEVAPIVVGIKPFHAKRLSDFSPLPGKVSNQHWNKE